MWRKLTTLVIVAGMAGPAMAQQEQAAADAAAAAEVAKAREAEARVRAQVAADEAQRVEVKRVADAQLELQLEKVRADRAAADADVEAARARQAQDVAKYRRVLAERLATPKQTRKEMLPYCGVSTSEVIAVLAEQLKLSKGMGLVVDFVETGSPAEAAGVKQHDVLTKFNDQLLTNPEQLRVLVRLKKPSDDVKLALIRRGEPTSVNIELGQKEMEVAIENAGADAAPPGIVALAMAPDGQLAIEPATTVETFRGGGGGGGGMVGRTNVNGKVQSVWSDGQDTLFTEIKDNRAVKLTVKDQAGKERFNGPVETDEQRKALPPGIAEKLVQAESALPKRAVAWTTVVNDNNPVMIGGGGVGMAPGAPAFRAAVPRARVLTSTDKETLMLARFDKGKATHVFAFSQADGKTLFDGPVGSDEQRKALPAAVLAQLETLEKNQAAAGEFGAIGR